MKNTKRKLLALLLSVSMLASALTSTITAQAQPGYDLNVLSLRTNSVENAAAVDTPNPTFSWQIDSNLIGAAQTAYQIKLYDADEVLVWDSGKVMDSDSTYIQYPQDAPVLEAKSYYSWSVTVWDAAGKTAVSEPQAFTTGFMSTSLSAWEGARWIGADELYLDAETLGVYRLNYDMQLKEGSTEAGFVFGAEDPKLSSPVYNEFLIGGENYISYQLDVSTIPAVMKIYRVGYSNTDTKEIPFKTIEIPESILNQSNRYDEHRFGITISGKKMENLTIDGQTIDTDVTLSASIQVLYPCLNSIGFATDQASSAVFTDVSVQNYHAPSSTVFGCEIGAGYRIFEAGGEAVSVNGDEIQVGKGVLFYADPSYGSVPMLRKELNAEKEIKRATLYATSKGIYELYLNGERVGDDYFSPGDTDYRQQIQYTCYDVTDQMEQGGNVIGAVLASGWYTDQVSYELNQTNFYGEYLELLAQLEIEYTDGTTQTVGTDDSWRYYGNGPVRYAGNFNGEKYDARLEEAVDGWSTADYDDSGWKNAAEKESEVAGYEPRIVAKADPGVKAVEELCASYVGEQTRNGQTVYLYDMGVNMVGVPKIKLPAGESGQKITLRFAEILYPEYSEDGVSYGELTGLLATENYRTAYSTDTYIMRGAAGGETYQPSFTFHGYQYLEVSGIDQAIPADNIKGIVLSSITEPTSRYETSETLTNQLFQNIMRSAYGNHLSIPTDCPQRDERMGWTGDAQIFSRTATYFADMNRFYNNYTSIMRDGQDKTSGEFSDYAPSFNPVGEGGARGSIGYSWSAAGVIVPYETYLQYGDESIIWENYDAMTLHVEYLMDNHLDGKKYLTSQTGFLADHLSIDTTDTAMLGNATFYYVMTSLARMAQAIGKTEDAQRFAAFAQGVQAEWNSTYVDPATHRTADDTQASYALPLSYDVFDDQNKPYAQQYLAQACAESGFTITTGFVGTAPLLPALTDAGNLSDAYSMFEQTDYASWLYPVTRGATSVWERWNSYIAEDSYGNKNGMRSFNHYSLGAVGAWMMGYQVGIQRDETPGFQSFVLQPTVGGSFRFVNGAYDSNYGTIVSNWTAQDGRLASYQAVVPANTTATLYLPVEQTAVDRFRNIDGVTFAGMTQHNGQECAKFSLQAGGYEFRLTGGSLTASIQDGFVTNSSADKTILRTVLAYAEAQYASEQFDTLIDSVQLSYTAALEDARGIDANLTATQQEVDDAWKALLNEIHKLGFVRGDRAALGELITLAESFLCESDRYTTATVDLLVWAVDAAKAVYQDGNALQQEVDQEQQNLLEAMLQLRYKADKSILEAVLAEAAELDTTVFTPERVRIFQAAKSEAEEVYGDPNALQSEVDRAAQTLRDAINALKSVPSTSTEPAVQGDIQQTAGRGTPKTGDTGSILFALFTLTGAGLLFSRKKR